MKMNVRSRVTEKKRESKRLRRQGMIPAVLYGGKEEPIAITIADNEFQAVLRQTPKGRLSTTVFYLISEDGKERKAILKDVQYHPTTYNILHLDFEELKENVKVKVNVPIECTGAVDCVGVKQGGTLRQVIRNIRVSCLPKDIPSCFTLDVKSLGIRQHKKVSDIEIPKGIQPITKQNEVAVVVAKR